MVLANSLVWANWFVAGGTIALALGTGYLGLKTKASVEKATEEVRLERERAEASQTPRVFPILPLGWSVGDVPYNKEPRHWHDVLPVQNGGPGVALNVSARLEWPDIPGEVVLTLPTSIAPGDLVDLRIDRAGDPQTDWRNVIGRLTYTDIAGAIWQTSFRIDTAALSRRRVTVNETIRMASDGATVSSRPSLVRRFLRR